MDWKIHGGAGVRNLFYTVSRQPECHDPQEKGRNTLGKWSRAIDVRFFTIKDSVEKKYLEIKYCLTDLMVGDFFTKPLQGSKFL